MTEYKTDLEIAREAKKNRIANLASESLSISEENLIPYGLVVRIRKICY